MKKLFAGYGEKIITPPPGIDLCGYGFYLDRRAESVLDDLKARALFLKNDSQALILISCDLIGFAVEFSDAVRQEISSRHNLPFQNILLACIHTHSGPATQSLPGLGEVNPAYLEKVKASILEAVAQSEEDLSEADFTFSSEVCEPIGFNRRKRDFEEIDSQLNAAIFRQGNRKIYLLNYACHAVTLGPTKQVSADWPGALIREVEKDSNKGIFFQGFCGDIDPVSNLNRWGAGTKEDLLLYGKMLWARARKAESFAKAPGEPSLKAAENRISLPIYVCKKNEIEKEVEIFLEHNRRFPQAERVIREWKKKALENFDQLSKNPFMENIPIQAAAIGGLKILGLPGEVFCLFGIKLRKKYTALLTLGYSGGSIGYLPTRKAYSQADDYACYAAPKFYSVFPFSPEIERILLKESQTLLAKIA
jgi:neutral ceramidase